MSDIESPLTGVVTNEEIAARLDSLGQQMDWLCENMSQLFQFVGAVSNNGGGIRGLMRSLKDQQPNLSTTGNTPVGSQIRQQITELEALSNE